MNAKNGRKDKRGKSHVETVERTEIGTTYVCDLGGS